MDIELVVSAVVAGISMEHGAAFILVKDTVALALRSQRIADREIIKSSLR